MSFVIGSLHPPSLISSVTTADIGYDALILSRGNELLISEISDLSVSKPKIFQFFGNILSICSFDSNKLAILFETEKLLLFEIVSDQLHCFNQCVFNYRIGRKVPTTQFSASNSLIVCHTRVRTIQVIIPSQSISFTQYLPFIEIYTIKCFDDTMNFIIFGKNLKNNYHVVLYEVNDNTVNQIKSVSFPDSELRPSILIESLTKFYFSTENQVQLFEDFDLKTNLYTHGSEITSLFQINDDTIALCDVKNKVFNISNQYEMISLEGIESIIPIGHDFFFELSNDNDSHLLKFKNSIFKIFDTFAQLNCTLFMDRSQLITKSGIIRSLVNGSATAEQMKININCGKLIWNVLNSFIVISTFDSTIVLETKKYSQVDANFASDAETLSVIVMNDNKNVIQITTNKIRHLSFSLANSVDDDDEEEEVKLESTFSDTLFKSGVSAVQVTNYGHNFSIAFSDNTVSFYAFFEADSNVILIQSLEVPHEVSALAMNDSSLSVSFWNLSEVHTFNLTSFELISKVKIDHKNETYVSSLINESEGEKISLIAGCNDGKICILKRINDEKDEYNITVINVSSSSIRLKRIRNEILIISDVSAFLHKQKSVKQNEEIDDKKEEEEEIGNDDNEDEKEEVKIDDDDENCEYKVDFISVSASFDACELFDNIAFLSSRGINVLSIESNHHSHIEDRSAIFNTITLISVDETNHCPIVYSIKSQSKSKTDFCPYTLYASGCKPFKLGMEVPRCMIWFFHNSDYFLVVGCEIEKSGRLILFNNKLEKISTTDLSLSVDAMCSVFNTYIAVASGKTLKGFVIDKDQNLVCKCTEQTRIKCASLTSPNSFAVVYADKTASASIYKMCDDQIALIAHDMNPKSLKFARLESETDILAIGDNSIIYNLSLVDNTKLKTIAAFNINCDVNAVFCSPNLAFITKSGSMQVIMKKDEIFVKIYRVMKKRVHGLGGLSISEFRTVEKNGNQYDNGKFVDGDFIQLFNLLSNNEQIQIAKIVGIDASEIKQLIKQYTDDLVAYREESQKHPRF